MNERKQGEVEMVRDHVSSQSLQDSTRELVPDTVAD